MAPDDGREGVARKESWNHPNLKKQLIQQFLLSDSITLPLSWPFFFHSKANQVILSVSRFHLKILLFVAAHTRQDGGINRRHRIFIKSCEQGDETSLSVRERHERAGALIIDRMIKADEEGFLPQ